MKVFLKKVRTLKPLAVKMSNNMGTTNGWRIDLAQKICVRDVITLFIYLHCDVIRYLPVQTWFVYFS